MIRKPPVWKRGAQKQLSAIVDYLWEIEIDLSARFMDAVAESSARLSHVPKMGHAPRDYAAPKDLRELLIWDYRLGYRVTPRQIEIMYIVHTRRRFPPAK